jgi:ElaB/YqjD/DUF883 family membrane-anchored ribosome-binding protein
MNMAQFESDHAAHQTVRTKQSNTNGHSVNKESAAAIDMIRKDIGQLQTQLSTLARDIGVVGTSQFSHATGYINRSVSQLKDSSSDYMRRAEDRIKENPGQAISIAFAVGLLASYLVRRR